MASFLCAIWNFLSSLFSGLLDLIFGIIKSLLDLIVDVIEALVDSVFGNSSVFLFGLAALGLYLLLKDKDNGKDKRGLSDGTLN
jgi:hypothetical protein